MNIVERILGPASKSDRRLPYTYEAKVPVSGVEGMVQRYLDDTLGGLLEALDKAGISPDEVRIVEVRPTGDFPVLIEHCTGTDERWLRRPEACRSFKAHYAGHTDDGRCCYVDRSREASGPFVEFEPAKNS